MRIEQGKTYKRRDGVIFDQELHREAEGALGWKGSDLIWRDDSGAAMVAKHPRLDAVEEVDPVFNHLRKLADALGYDLVERKIDEVAA